MLLGAVYGGIAWKAAATNVFIEAKRRKQTGGEGGGYDLLFPPAAQPPFAHNDRQVSLALRIFNRRKPMPLTIDRKVEAIERD